MENNKKVILLNGKPGCGKDEALVQLSIHYKNTPITSIMFKEKLFELVLSIYDIDETTFFSLYNNRELKETPTPLLNGLSPREAMIFVSEEVIKPKFGKDYFGNVAASKLREGVNIFTDSGFIEETEPVYDACDGNMMILRIFNETAEKVKDSRSYIESFRDCAIIDVHNNGTDLMDYRHKLVEAVDDFLRN